MKFQSVCLVLAESKFAYSTQLPLLDIMRFLVFHPFLVCVNFQSVLYKHVYRLLSYDICVYRHTQVQTGNCYVFKGGFETKLMQATLASRSYKVGKSIIFSVPTFDQQLVGTHVFLPAEE